MWKNIKNKVFREYFGYQSPSFPAFLAIFSCPSINTNSDKNKQIVNQIIESINYLKNDSANEEIAEHEYLKKIIDIVERIINFNKEQKVTGLKILTTKQMFQRLPIALAKVKAGNNSESLLNEIRQITYSLY